jgi:predicted lipoprotein with Yx(FWY)xxD motif
MFLNKRSIFAVLLPALLLTVFFAACGTSTTTSSSTPTATLAPTATPTTAPMPVVKTTSVMLNGKSVTILTDMQGMTLYYYKPDTATSVKCAGSCEKNWPALKYTGSGTPTGETSLPGMLSVINGANGMQVEYQGHPLYTYIGDKKAGDANGEGKGNVWYVATTDLTAASGTASTPTPSSKGPTPTPTSSYNY